MGHSVTSARSPAGAYLRSTCQIARGARFGSVMAISKIAERTRGTSEIAGFGGDMHSVPVLLTTAPQAQLGPQKQ